MKKLFNYLKNVSALGYQRWRNLPVQPRFINFLLTYKCNAQCLMCNIWDIYRNKPQQAQQELTINQIERFLSANQRFLAKLMHVGFTGGEPLTMRADFVQIVRLFRKYLPRTALGAQTNGLNPELVRDKLKQILEFYPKFSLAVSLDGIGDTHNQMRGKDDAFSCALKTISYAKELGVKRITCGMTLTPDNYNQISQVKQIAEGLSCEFSCFLAEQAEYFNTQNQNNNILTQEQKQQIARELIKLFPQHYFMHNLGLILSNKRKPKIKCFSGFSSLVIDPYGNIKPCILKVKGIANDIFGNIKYQSLEELLSSPKAKQIKQKIKQCSCWCQCEVSSSAIVWPMDVLGWFLFRCGAKRQFLRTQGKRAMKVGADLRVRP